MMLCKYFPLACLLWAVTTIVGWATPATLTVNCGSVTSLLNKDVNGVNHGPLMVMAPGEAFDYNSNPPNWVDLTSQYSAAGISWVRTDELCTGDVNVIYPLGSGGDINNPAYYYFQDIDQYLQRTLDAGCKVIFRLAFGDAQASGAYYPPADYNRYAQICRNIIKHFNSGWGNGHYWNIKYIEFWNEPDIWTWQGTPTQFTQLYNTVATTLKAYDPTLKVGAFGAAYQTNSTFAQTFLSLCHQYNVPLDFFSWHQYTGSPYEIYQMAYNTRVALNSYGFTSTESIITEYSGIMTNHDVVDEGCFLAALVGYLSPGDLVSKVMYYTGSSYVMPPSYQPYAAQWGMFDPLTAIPRPNYYAAQMYGVEANATPYRVAASGPADMVPPIAAKNAANNQVIILVNNLFTSYNDYTISVQNLPFTNFVVEPIALDGTHMNTYLYAPLNGQASGGSFVYHVPVAVQAPSLFFLRLTKQ